MSGSAIPLLIFGIGNSGRGDDGLGWAFLDRMVQEADFPGRPEYRYQLQVEDAALASQADHVVFVDSCQAELPGGFGWEPCRASANCEFTSHILPPGAVLHLCRELYGKSPRSNLLLIQGVSWELQTAMSENAVCHLLAAWRFFRDCALRSPQHGRGVA